MTTSASTREWVQLTEPASLSPDDIFRFFGIPPSPEADLERNIKAKRQFWTKRANGPGGRELAAKVKQNIQNLSKVLEEGAVPERIVPTSDGRYKILGEARTPLELAEQLELFLRAGDWANVVATARLGLERWPDNTDVIVAVALALSEIVRDGASSTDDVRTFAVWSTDHALAKVPTDPDVWLAKARVLLALGTVNEVATLEDRATAQGVSLPAELYAIVAAASFRAGDVESGICRLVRSVESSNGDPGIRSVATDAMIREVLVPMLPLTDRKAARAFAEAVQVAAWLAEGVPESEAELVKFRIWAAEAEARVFIGDVALKSFLGVVTGFVALPVYSTIASRPGWRVLNDGPADKDSWHRWLDVAEGEFIEELHQLSSKPFAWQHGVRATWPTRDQVIQAMTSEAT